MTYQLLKVVNQGHLITMGVEWHEKVDQDSLGGRIGMLSIPSNCKTCG